MADDANKIYIQLSKEISDLDKDLTRGLASVGYMAKANKTELDNAVDRIKDLEKELKHVQQREAADKVRIQALEEARREHTGKFATLTEKKLSAEAEAEKESHKQRTEQLKAKLSFWGPILLLIVTNIVSLILHWAGVSSGN